MQTKFTNQHEMPPTLIGIIYGLIFGIMLFGDAIIHSFTG